MDVNEFTAVLMDVSGLLTRGSDAARQEARRIHAERERRVAANALAGTDQPVSAAAQATDRIPVRFVSLGVV